MRSFLVTGDEKKRNEFIQSFVLQEKIPVHSVIYFTQELDISNAKELKRILSRKHSDKTLVVLPGINPIAQNALLKTIEEIQGNISMIVSLESDENILDTIKSRLFLVSAGAVLKDEREIFDINVFSGDKTDEKLKAIDDFLDNNSKETSTEIYVKFLNLYRQEVLKNHEKLNSGEIMFHAERLKNLIKNYRLIKSNNLNVRITLESEFL